MKLPVGPKQAQQATQWIRSLSTFGFTAGLGVLYFTDWKLILQFVPYYNGKFVKPE